MAYAGYLLKVGGTVLPFKYIRFDSYKCTPNQRLEGDGTGRDATGGLHRETAEKVATKIEFETPPLTDVEVVALNALLRAGMTNTLERRVTLEYYVDETGSYKTGEFYIPDIEYSIYFAEGARLHYNPVRVAFIGYGEVFV